jgi:tetratricopeptide (TPR) repeat protein
MWRATGFGRAALALTWVGVLLSGAVPTARLEAQAGRGSTRPQVSEAETRLLREASTLEARGDNVGAERVLRGLLEQIPGSTGALFAIERSLRAQGRTRDVLPLIDRTLAVQPGLSNLRSMKLRLLVEIDSLETLEQEAQTWIRAEPGSPDPYRELARMYERAYGTVRTVALLREGRASLNDPAAFAVELGELLERSGQRAEAAREWSLAIGDDGGQAPAVIRRVGQLPDSSRAVVPLLIEALDKDPTTPARRVAAVRVALAVPLPEQALALTRRAVGQLDLSTRRSLLEEVARRGEELDAHQLSLWAYETLRDLATDPTAQRALQTRVAASALALGDTAKALEARAQLAQSLPRGSTERRRVVAETLRLQATRSNPEALRRQLSAFREEFPDAPELDEIASALAYGLQAQGNGDAAAAVLADVQGPRSALERAYLSLDRGEVEEGIASLTQAVESLPPAAATDVIQLVSLLGRVGPGSASALGKAAVLSHRGAGVQAVEQLVAEVPRLPVQDRSALLAHAARLADQAAAPERGAALRRELIAQHKDSAERPEAALALARWSARSGRTQEAIQVLEALIVERPTSPLVPDARRELERIRGVAAGGPGEP